MVLPEQNLGRVLSNVFSITYNKVNKLENDTDHDIFKNEMNTGYTMLFTVKSQHIYYVILIAVIETDGYITLMKAIFGRNSVVDVSTKNFSTYKKYNK